MQNIIFLDVDGVLNNENYIDKCYERHHQSMSMDFVPFDPKCLSNLRRLYDYILDKGDEPLIVLSSTWRLGDKSFYIVNTRLAEYGIYIEHYTPYIHSERGIEIIQWLTDNNHLTSPFVILDDDSFDIICHPELKNHLVHTKFKNGFVGWKLRQEIDILEKGECLNEARNNIKSEIY